MTAARMALANQHVRSTAIEANEFHEISERYQVTGVPKIVVNNSFFFLGGYPEDEFIDLIIGGLNSRD